MKKIIVFCFGILLQYSVVALAFNPVIATKTIKYSDSVNHVSKLKTANQISLITKSDLVQGLKNENIRDLVKLAEKEGAVSFADGYKYINSFSKIDGGDEALLHCLKMKGCDLDNFSLLLSSKGINTNELHRLIAYKYPNASAQVIWKKSGNISEYVMTKYYARNGAWEKIEGEYNSINGLDGLFVKRNKDGLIKDVLIVESKYNKGDLGKRSECVQMSKKCILNTLEKLDAVHGQKSSEYKTIIQFVENDIYKARLWNMNVTNSKLTIKTKIIHSTDATVVKAEVVGSNKGKMEYSGNSEFDLANPDGLFHKEIVGYYQEALSW